MCSVNIDGAALRNTVGSSSTFLSGQVVVRVVQSYLEPQTNFPFGGFFIDVNNNYCLRIRVTVTLPNGRIHEVLVNARENVPRIIIPERVDQGAVLHIGVYDAF